MKSKRLLLTDYYAKTKKINEDYKKSLSKKWKGFFQFLIRFYLS